jgi:hypothetical protein
MEDYYETTPSQKPAPQRRSIELQPSSILNLKINKNTQKRKKNKEKTDLQRLQLFMIIDRPLIRHFLRVVLPSHSSSVRVSLFYPATFTQQNF